MRRAHEDSLRHSSAGRHPEDSRLPRPPFQTPADRFGHTGRSQFVLISEHHRASSAASDTGAPTSGTAQHLLPCKQASRGMKKPTESLRVDIKARSRKLRRRTPAHPAPRATACFSFHEKVVFVKPDVAGSGAAGRRRWHICSVPLILSPALRLSL